MKEQNVRVSLSYSEYERLLKLAELNKELKKKIKPQRNLVRGLAGLQELLGCSKSTAWRVKNEPWFRPALVQVGHKIVIDSDIAWTLVHKYTGVAKNKTSAGSATRSRKKRTNVKE